MCNTHSRDQEGGTSNHKKQRCLLPTDFKPHQYDLVIKPDFVNFSFQGEESINLTTTTSRCHKIVLHCDDIQIDASSVELELLPLNKVNEESKKIKSKNISYDSTEQTVSIEFDESEMSSVQVNDSLVLRMNYTGILNDKMCGFYRSQYVDASTGESKWMGTTQFEAADARRAFPCFDEPALKATFNVTLIVPDHMDAISCMPVVSEEKLEGHLKRVKYDTTPVMSTYLLAFVIGEFDYIEEVSKHNKRVRVYTQKGKTELGKFALHVAVRSLDFFTELFEFDYPISKMDLLAIPDFAAGAMENMGCVTYRETRLLIDPVQSSQATKQATARTIAHEVSHMWFGNLVSPSWWRYLWLKEGFARFLEYFSVDELFPDWDMWTQFVQEVFSAAQNLDSLRSSHPVEVEVYNTGEISEIFDLISYAKGASLNRMLANWVGIGKVKTGLQNYIKEFAYRSTVTEDLWKSLEDVSQLPVKEVMDTFVKQTGYPVVSVEEKHVEGGLELHLTQTRFLLDGTTDDTKWMIPIRVTAGRPTILAEELDERVQHPLILMKEKHMKCTLKHIDQNDWIKLNSNQSGFYRVKYSSSLLKKLAEAVREGKLIDPADRLGLVSDVFALAKAGHGSLTDCFDLIQNFSKEQEYSVWAVIAENVSTVESIFKDESISPMMYKFIISLFKGLFPKYGWSAKPDEGHLDALFRSTIISKLLDSDDKDITKEAKELFDRALNGQETIAPDIRGTVYKSVVRNGGKEEFDKVLSIYETSSSQEEKVRAIVGICATKDHELIQRAISYIWSDKVRRQDICYPLSAMAGNTKGEELSWAYVKNNWDTIYSYFGAGHAMLGGILASSTRSFNSDDKAAEVEEFFKRSQQVNQVNGIERAYQQSAERIRYKANLISRERDNLLQWLSLSFK